MKEFFKRKKDEGADGEPKLGGVFFGFTKDGKKHMVSVEDMPEDVRAYFEELGRQTHEEGGGGMIMLDSANVPDYVAAYFEKQVADALKDTDVTQLRMKDLPRGVVEAVMMEQIDELERRILEKNPEHKAHTDNAAGILKMVFKALLHKDEDWRRLTMEEVNNLYGGVCIAMMEITVAAANLNKVGWEDRKDEENT